jgi:HAE1 family hydrophobic/amphiphilic exporter-1
MWLTQIAIKRPYFIVMIVCALMLLGYQSLKRMPVDLFPKVDIPYVTIMTIYPGAGPEEVETKVSKIIEDAVSSVSNVKSVKSMSYENVSVIVMEFKMGTNLDVAASDVREKVEAVKRNLPDDAYSPTVSKVDIGATPVVYIGMAGRRTPKEIRKIADDIVKDRLSKVPGVASVGISGGEIREIQVLIDKERLKAYNLTILNILQFLQAGNISLPAGSIKEERKEYSVRLVGEYKDVKEIEEQRIFVQNPDPRKQEIAFVKLKEIAEVKDTTKERDTYTRLNRKECVGITVVKQADANTVSVADGVKKELEQLKKELPSDIEIGISWDQSEFIKDALHEGYRHLFLGSLLACLIVYLFLHNLRATFIIALAIPTSIMATFLLIYSFGFTINMMVILAFALAVGILVDDSIVVLENIHRHLKYGETPEDAAFNGRTEIGLAAIAITLVDVVVFVPIAFTSGIVGQFFKAFGLTVATATLFSLFVSFTLTPMLASKWFKRERGEEEQKGLLNLIFKRFDNFYDTLDLKYRGVLAWALRHKFLVIILGILSLLIVAPLMKKLGFEFQPTMDQGQFSITAEMPSGTSLKRTNEIAGKIEEFLSNRKEYPEIENIYTAVGTSSTSMLMQRGTTSSEYVSISVKLCDYKKRKRTTQQIVDDIRSKLNFLPDAKISMTAQSGFAAGMAPIEIELSGSDMKELNEVAQRIKEVVINTPGCIDVDVSWKIGKPEIQAKVDREKAIDLGLTPAQIALALRYSIEGNTDMKFREGGDEYEIRVRLKDIDRNNIEDVGEIVVGNKLGVPVLLKDVADISFTYGPTKIDRKNRQRMVAVTSNLKAGYALGNVRQEIDKRLKNIDLKNVKLYHAGMVEHMEESFADLFSALSLSIILVYMIMVSLYDSLLYPFIVMLSLPLAIVGAIIALVLTGKTLSIVSMIGIIMLVGLVAKNAILLVDYTNTLRARGYKIDDAIKSAGPTRLRPILMTTLTMIFGMLPTALATGGGGGMRAPMAIAVIGGLIWSTLLTLIVIPVVYTLFDALARKLGFRRFEEE